MQKWDYLAYKMKSESYGNIQLKLDQLGNEGWELVAVTHSTSDGTMLYFKRPKS